MNYLTQRGRAIWLALAALMTIGLSGCDTLWGGSLGFTRQDLDTSCNPACNPDTQICENGTCVAIGKCANVQCTDPNQECNAATGQCVDKPAECSPGCSDEQECMNGKCVETCSPTKQCSKGTDRCNNGVCEPVPSGPETCSATKPCSNGSDRCHNGICVPNSCSNNDDNACQAKWPDTRCINDTCVDNVCTSDSECDTIRSGERCIAGKCGPNHCSDDSECTRPNERCINNQCAVNYCDASTPCRNGERCESNKCVPNTCDKHEDCKGQSVPMICDKSTGTGLCAAEVCSGTDDSTCLPGKQCRENKCVDNTCTNDTECKRDGQRCIKGACANNTCAGDNDCRSGEYCNNKKCESLECNPNLSGSCNNSSRGDTCIRTTAPDKGLCHPSNACFVDSDCVSNRCVKGTCKSDACTKSEDCRAGEVCNSSNQCVPDTCDGMTTTCPSGERCDTTPGQRVCVKDVCEFDSDCGNKQRCERHICIDDPAACTGNTHCRLGEQCVSGKCKSTHCLKDGDCPTDQWCQNRVCVAKTCAHDSQCRGGQFCNNGLCEDDQCELDTECGATEFCDAGVCKPKSCTQNSDCRNAQICDTSTNKCIDQVCNNASDSCDVSGARCNVKKNKCELNYCVNDNNCAADEFCNQGVCKPKDCSADTDCRSNERCNTNKCVINTCTDDTQCDAGERCTGGKCGPADCRVLDHCKVGEEYCDTSSSAPKTQPAQNYLCKAGCEENAHCPTAKPVCKTSTSSTNTCVECTEQIHCGANSGKYCNTTNNQCETGCLADNNCPTDKVCNTSNKTCVECLTKNDCPANTKTYRCDANNTCIEDTRTGCDGITCDEDRGFKCDDTDTSKPAKCVFDPSKCGTDTPECGGVCCKTGGTSPEESCFENQCETIVCSSGRALCRVDGAATCCDSGKVCSNNLCVTPTTDTCDNKTSFCGANAYCDTTLGKCVNYDTQHACYKAWSTFEAPVERLTWTEQVGTDRNKCTNVRMVPLVADVDPDEKNGPEIIFQAWGGNDCENPIYVIRGKYNEQNPEDVEVVWNSRDTTNPPIRVQPETTPAIGKLKEKDAHLTIVAITSSGTLVRLNAKTGEKIGDFGNVQIDGCTVASCPNKWNNNNYFGDFATVTLADLDHDGKSEILVDKYVLDADLNVLCTLDEQNRTWVAADLDNTGNMEFVGGRQTYSFDETQPVGHMCQKIHTNSSPSTYTENPSMAAAVADFGGDDKPEIVVSGMKHLYFLDYKGNEIAKYEYPPLFRNPKWPWGQGERGAPPTIADFDNDGKLEIGVAYDRYYFVFEVENYPATSSPTELKVKWFAKTYDLSGWTSSSVFDFNGDGKAEVVYGDEQNVYIYNGDHDSNVNFASGEKPSSIGTNPGDFNYPNQPLVKIKNVSSTLLEYPVIADVNGDGSAEIIFGSSPNPTPEKPEYKDNTAALRVFGSRQGNWVGTRSIWNQHTYHITNVKDDGTIPRNEVASWASPHTNSFRQNVPTKPSKYAANLEVSMVDVPSYTDNTYQTSTCDSSDYRKIKFEIRNTGLRGVPAKAFKIKITAKEIGTSIEETITDTMVNSASIPAGASIVETYDWDMSASTLQGKNVSITVNVNNDSTLVECRIDTDNVAEVTKVYQTQSDLKPDNLAIDLHNCDRTKKAKVTFVLKNKGKGNFTAQDAKFTIVYGVSGGKEKRATGEINSDIAVNGSTSITAEVDIDTEMMNKPLEFKVIVDADVKLSDCDRSNNEASASASLICIDRN